MGGRLKFGDFERRDDLKGELKVIRLRFSRQSVSHTRRWVLSGASISRHDDGRITESINSILWNEELGVKDFYANALTR
jgi:hypothetical protein